MSLSCPNKRLKVWKDLVQQVGENKAYLLWATYQGNVPDNYYQKQAEIKEEVRELIKPDLNSLISNTETNIFEDTSVTENSNDETVNNNLAKNKEILFKSEPKLKFKAEEVLKNILESDDILKFKEAGFFLNQMMNLINKSGATFQVISQDKFDNFNVTDDTLMVFDATNNTIYISHDRLESISPELLVETFIHELTHSVTVKAYFEPSNPLELEFKEFIDKAFQQYSYLNKEVDENGNNIYGFTNQAEFIAEIYSNPEFRNRIETLEKGFLQRFIEFIRRMFNLSKNEYNNELISSQVLFDKVDNFIKYDSNVKNWKGTIVQNPNYQIFEKKENNVETNLSTIEDKINHAVSKAQESLTLNIEKYNHLTKIYKDNENLAKYLQSLREIQEAISDIENTNKLKAIEYFLEHMSRSLNTLETYLDNLNMENKEAIKNAGRIYSNSLSTYSVISDVKDVLAELSQKPNDFVSKEELNVLNTVYDTLSGKYSRLKGRIETIQKESLRDLIHNIKYFPEVEKKHYDRLANEWRNNKIPLNKELWIISQMRDRDKELIDKDLSQAVNNFLENPFHDIISGDVYFSNAVNVSSPLIQVINTLFKEVDNERINEEKEKDIEFKNLFTKLVDEKGTTNVNELYKNILDKSKSGKYYLKGEYKAEFFEEVYLKIKNLKREAYDKINTNKTELLNLAANNLENTSEYDTLVNENKKIKEELDIQIAKIEKDNVIKDNKGNILRPSDKWKNDLKLSNTELEVLNYFKSITEETHKNTYGANSLIHFMYSKGKDIENKYERYTTFYELPKVTKTLTERIWAGTLKGHIKDQWTDLTEIRPDDVDYNTVETDLSGKPIHRLKINYRGNLDNDNQSLDLFSIYRLEYKNGNSYKHKKEIEQDLNFLLDLAKSKKYYKKQGTSSVVNKRNEKLDLIEGDQSNTVKMIENLLETKLYDILNKTGTKLGKTEMNKVVSKITGFSSFMALAANITSGVANVTNANAQLFLESFIKGHFIKSSNIKKANEKYFKDFGNTLRDNVEAIRTSYSNQVLELFNVKGEFLFSEHNFLRQGLIKSGLHLENLQVFQSSGEHWVQSIIAMSVLDGVKVMNENHQFIDKKGNVVENENKAASVLDMLEKDDSGILKMNNNVVYTTHSRLTKWNEGGKVKIDYLVEKKIYDSVGAYKQTDQAELYRHWWGKLVGQFKKYLIPMGQARLRGIQHALTDKENLTDEQRTFSYALQEYEEGTYVTTIRYLVSSLRKGVKIANFIDNWKNLTDYERHNVKRAIIEIIMTSVILPLLVTLFNAAADDDDNEFLFFIAYQLRRLDTELSAYRSISEMFKMMRSPIPSTRILEHSINTVFQIVNPFEWDDILNEEYVSGKNKGKNKFLIRQGKQIPILRETLRTYEDLLEFQSSTWGTAQ